jgi:hypothetical protein
MYLTSEFFSLFYGILASSPICHGLIVRTTGRGLPVEFKTEMYGEREIECCGPIKGKMVMD